MKIKKIKKVMKINRNIKNVARVCVILGIFAASKAEALFQVSEYQSPEAYGNAQIPCFRGAMTGNGLPLSAEEEARMAASLPVRELGHFYGRFSVNVGSISLSSVRNASNVLPYSASTGPSVTSLRKTQTGLELALGYVYSRDMRLEAEYLVNKNFTYTGNPALGGLTTNQQVSAEITNNTLLFNLYYEYRFGGYDRFRPFLVGGLGVGMNSVRATASGSLDPINFANGARTKQKGSLAGGGGIGFRFLIYSRLSFTASVRYIHLGKISMEPTTNLKLSGNYSMIPFSLGLIYLF